MRELNQKGGLPHMATTIVINPVLQPAERSNVFRSTPYEFELTSNPVSGVMVFGSLQMVDTRVYRQVGCDAEICFGPTTSVVGVKIG